MPKTLAQIYNLLQTKKKYDMKKLPKHHDRLPGLADIIKTVANNLPAIEIIDFEDLPEEVQKAFDDWGHEHLHAVALDIFTIVANAPRCSRADIIKTLNITRQVYSSVIANRVIYHHIISLRRSVIEDDVLLAQQTLREAMCQREDMRTALAAAKFVLENNGGDFGYGKQQDNSAPLRVILEEAIENKRTYTDEELEDV